MTTKRQVLVVDDDAQLCALVRAALELDGIEVLEAGHAIEAEKLILEHVPDAVVLDVGLPGIDGIFYTQRLRESPRTRHLPIVVISGSAQTEQPAAEAGASAYLRKPFDPLELLALLQRLMGDTSSVGAATPGLQDILELGRRQRELADDANRKTLMALATALGSSDHSELITAYAMRLTLEVEPALTDDPSLEWGFMLHDVDEEILATLPLLQGEGIRAVRHRHERWDGTGYPDRLTGTEIPVGARILAAVHALDALTEPHPERAPLTWGDAIEELRREAGSRFDPDVVDGIVACEPDLHAIRHPELRRAAQAG